MRGFTIITSSLLMALAIGAPVKRTDSAVGFHGAPNGGSVNTIAPGITARSVNIDEILGNIVKRQDESEDEEGFTGGDDSAVEPQPEEQVEEEVEEDDTPEEEFFDDGADAGEFQQEDEFDAGEEQQGEEQPEEQFDQPEEITDDA